MQSTCFNGNTWFTIIDKLSYWKLGEWVKFAGTSSKITILRVHFDQLFITVDNKILETFNMNARLKGIYKEDVLILIASAHGQEIRKLRFQVKTNPMYCFEKLCKHFPVISHNGSSKKDDMIYRNIEDIFQKALEENGSNDSEMKIPPNYAEFVKLCLLDPTFPYVVKETEKIIKTFKTFVKK